MVRRRVSERSRKRDEGGNIVRSVEILMYGNNSKEIKDFITNLCDPGWGKILLIVEDKYNK
jgi:hypothetical protein